MSSAWAQKPLGSLVDDPITYGVVKPGAEAADGVKLVRATDIQNGAILTHQLRTISTDLSVQYKRTILRGGEVLISLVGNPGQVAVAPPSLRGSNINRAVGLIRPSHEMDARFLAAFLSSPVGAQRLQALVYGSVQQVINLGDLKGLLIPVPPLEEQRRIADTLGAIDALIEVDEVLARDLRSMTRIAFRRLVSGPGEVVAASEVMDLKYGKSLRSSDRVPGPVAVVSSAGIVDTHDQAMVSGPGVVIGRKGNVGSVTWVPGDFFPIDTTFYVSTSLPMLFTYLSIERMGLASMNTDSAVPGLNRANALTRTLIIPSSEDLERFMAAAECWWTAAHEIDKDVLSLRRTRDEILRLLLSGRLTVLGAA